MYDPQINYYPTAIHHLGIISICHPEPFGVAQDKLREGSIIYGSMVLTPLAMTQLQCRRMGFHRPRI